MLMLAPFVAPRARHPATQRLHRLFPQRGQDDDYDDRPPPLPRVPGRHRQAYVCLSERLPSVGCPVAFLLSNKHQFPGSKQMKSSTSVLSLSATKGAPSWASSSVGKMTLGKVDSESKSSPSRVGSTLLSSHSHARSLLSSTSRGTPHLCPPCPPLLRPPSQGSLITSSSSPLPSNTATKQRSEFRSRPSPSGRMQPSPRAMSSPASSTDSGLRTPC